MDLLFRNATVEGSAPCNARGPTTTLGGDFIHATKARLVINDHYAHSSLSFMLSDSLCFKGHEHCRFFKWIDPEICPRAHQIISGLIKSKNKLERQLDAVSRRHKNIWRLVITYWSLMIRSNSVIHQLQVERRGLELQMMEMKSR